MRDREWVRVGSSGRVRPKQVGIRPEHEVEVPRPELAVDADTDAGSDGAKPSPTANLTGGRPATAISVPTDRRRRAHRRALGPRRRPIGLQPAGLRDRQRGIPDTHRAVAGATELDDLGVVEYDRFGAVRCLERHARTVDGVRACPHEASVPTPPEPRHQQTSR